MNLTELSENGRIEYLDINEQKTSFESQERLTSVDFSTLAMSAKMNKDYASAIIFLRESLRLMPKESGLRSQPKEVKNRTLKLKKVSQPSTFHEKYRYDFLVLQDLVQLNNGYLTKWQIRAEKDFLVLPYLIDENLKKKKKQPAFVKENENIHPLIKNDQPKIDQNVKVDYFVEICRRGKIMPSLLPFKALKCRFLHHKNPYLKLGPFKEEHVSQVPYAVVFHDILSDLEMDNLIDNARPMLSKSR